VGTKVGCKALGHSAANSLIPIDPDAAFLQTPELMQKHHVSKLVVVNDDILSGVITVTTVAAQCTTYVHQTVHDMMRWTGFGF
jgi:CBS domain-containing protein